jgi:hypothetical protein
MNAPENEPPPFPKAVVDLQSNSYEAMSIKRYRPKMIEIFDSNRS